MTCVSRIEVEDDAFAFSLYLRVGHKYANIITSNPLFFSTSFCPKDTVNGIGATEHSLTQFAVVVRSHSTAFSFASI